MQHILWVIVEKRLAIPLAQWCKEKYNKIIEMDNEPDLGKFEPTDELFERIAKEAHERGLLKED